MKFAAIGIMTIGFAACLVGCSGNNPFEKKDVALYNQGVELVNADKDLEAAEKFKQVLVANPNHPLAHYNLGVIYDDSGMFEEAIAEFQTALQINPKNVDAQYRLSIAYATQGMDQEAIEGLQKVLESESLHIPSHYNLAVLYEGMGEDTKAIEHYRKIVEIKPDDAEALNNLGLAYAKKQMWDAAQEQLEKAITAKPRYFEALNNLGVVLAQKAQYEKAALVFERAHKQNPDSAKTLFNLAKIHFENTRDYRAAVEYARKYMALAGRLEKKEEMQGILAGAERQLQSLQDAAATSIEGRIRKDAKDFLFAVQRADFRCFYVFQPAELRQTLSKEQWEKDMVEMDAVKMAEQKSALTKLIGFEDLLSVEVKSVTMISPQKAKVVLISLYGKEANEKELVFEEVNGHWAPGPFLQRIQENWDRAQVNTIQ